MAGDGDADSDADAGADGCPAGWRRCPPGEGGVCVYIRESTLNCGGCGIECAEGLSCIDGECGSDCGDLESCPSGCADIALDPTNCGGCGIVCDPGQNCLIGQCSGGGSSDLRLVGGASAREGRVEILNEGQWGTICDDNWDAADAQVACRQLGYHGGTPCQMACFGQGAGTIWMDSINCVGTEASLDLCPFGGWGVNDCSHGEDSGVTCDP